MTKLPNDVAIRVDDVYKEFHLPHYNEDSLKRRVTQMFRKKDKSIDIYHALRGVSFDIKKGEFFGIVGRNGSGKSTLLKIISKIYQPTTGNSDYQGSLVAFIELGVGFNPQLTGRENVFLNGAMLGFSRSEMQIMYNEIVAFAELEEFMEQKLKNYSSGMKVRLAFSVAIRAEADILVLDEVLAVGDAAFQNKCYDYFAKLKYDGKTVILVTHNMANIEKFCNRALMLNEGEVAYIGSNDEAADRYRGLFEHPNQVIAGTRDAQSKFVKKIDISTLQDDNVTDDILAFKDFAINLRVVSNYLIKEPNVSLTITDRKGNLLFSKDTWDDIKISDVDKGGVIDLTYNIQNIYTNGEYSIGVVIMASNEEGDRVRIFDRQEMYMYKIYGVKKNSHSITHPKIRIVLK